MLAKCRRPLADTARRSRQPDRRLGERRRTRHAGKFRWLEEFHRLDVRIIERLLGRKHLAGWDLGGAKRGQSLGTGALGAPVGHPPADQLPMIAATDVVPKTRIGEPMGL